MVSNKLTENRGNPFGEGFTLAELSENLRRGDSK